MIFAAGIGFTVGAGVMTLICAHLAGRSEQRHRERYARLFDRYLGAHIAWDADNDRNDRAITALHAELDTIKRDRLAAWQEAAS